MDFTMGHDSNEEDSGAKAPPSRGAEAEAVRDKIARLRALRLAHEAANPPAGAKAGTGRSRVAKKTPAAKSVPLSDWLNDQEQQGRRK
jgi:hypothetical protein